MEEENSAPNVVDMEKVFFRLHSRIIQTVTKVFHRSTLKFMEYLALLNGLASLALLVYLHSSFVSKSAQPNCVVQQLKDGLNNFTLSSGGALPDVLQIQVGGIWSRLAEVDADGIEAVAKAKQQSDLSFGPDLLQVWLTDPTYIYSMEKGFLMLDQSVRTKYNVTEHIISLRFDCVGSLGGMSPKFLTFLLDNFVGYDTVVTNTLVHAMNGRGHVYSSLSRELFDLSVATFSDELIITTGEESTIQSFTTFAIFKIGILAMTLFLFFITTTLVHHTLRETQEKMLQFTIDLQLRIEEQLPYHNLIVNHVVNSLVFVPIMVGMLFFLFEFFNDQLLAFMILALVWVCELYSVVTLRTKTTIRLFPRLFLAYFCSFHLYFFSFPTGFSYLALTTTVLLLHHSMLCFWNRFEIPAFRRGEVSMEAPRQLVSTTGGLQHFEHGLPPSLAYHALVGERTSHEDPSMIGQPQGQSATDEYNQVRGDGDEVTYRTSIHSEDQQSVVAEDGERPQEELLNSSSTSRMRRKRQTLHNSPDILAVTSPGIGSDRSARKSLPSPSL